MPRSQNSTLAEDDLEMGAMVAPRALSSEMSTSASGGIMPNVSRSCRGCRMSSCSSRMSPQRNTTAAWREEVDDVGWVHAHPLKP